ncbi:hypothetical protein KVR01_006928 [Diaporthe batatas]|uniref:uncharacterized protein n=1 Tax=Diaporthe batatas TaxID=748121 RepID=UPI001D03DBE5|nr:uncharacterized protein KVR01_006928 [Diaporthe batatas]KAG8163631.1 hypothetical protein KVR01_006928 [Diaporthe batatas]
MAEPTEDEINAVCEMLDVYETRDRQMFSRALKAHNNNMAQVVNEYFEDQDTFRSKFSWNEAQFMADRDGSSLPSFQVQGPDQYDPTANAWDQSGGLVAPSRPPSRAQNRSPLGKMIDDWTTNYTVGAPTTQQQADEDLNRALLESTSAAATRGATPQESGVISTDTSLPFFGPANRETYQDDQWAMVRVNKEASDPSPSARKRDPLTPVFLLCRHNGAQRHRLGPLLMIKHDIPAARNFFLSLDASEQPGTYGHNNSWWKGDAILCASSGSTEALPEAYSYPNVKLEDEIQRLMAFLDDTQRSYGTADSLCESPLMKNAWDPVVHFYQNLYSKAGSEIVRSTMWTLVRFEPGADEVDASTSSPTSEFGILEFKVPDELSDVLHSLYSLWDALFWIQQQSELSGFPHEESKQTAYMEDPGEVLTMRIKLENHRIEIPETFYIDRYLEKNLGTARILKSQMVQLWQALAQSKDAENKITKWNDSADTWKDYDKISLTKKVIAKVENQIWKVRANALWRKHEQSVGTKDEIPYLPAELNHLAELNEQEDKTVKIFESQLDVAKRKLVNIDQQLARLGREKKACCDILRQMAEVLTVPSEEEGMNPTHKYTLRGVITSHDVVYMCRRKEADPAETEAPSSKVDQWWRVAWVAGDENPVRQEVTTFEKVQEAIFTETDADGSKVPILVYATDKALNEEPAPLSDALKTFVKFDNRLFKQELLEEPTPADKKRNAPQVPESPLKRQRSNSVDSMATNRASLGDFSDAGERDALMGDQDSRDGINPFQYGDGTAIMSTEMEEMRPTPSQELAASMGGAPPSPPMSARDDASDHGSPGIRRSSERLARISLDAKDQAGNGADVPKAPEMAERVSPVSPFIVRRPNGTVDKRASIMDQAMEIDGSMELPTADGNPEDYYK